MLLLRFQCTFSSFIVATMVYAWTFFSGVHMERHIASYCNNIAIGLIEIPWLCMCMRFVHGHFDSR